HADVAGPAWEEGTAGRSDVGAVRQLGIFLLENGILLLTRHVTCESERLDVEIRSAVHSTPDGEQVGAPFRGEARDTGRAEDAGGEFVTHLDLIPVAFAMT